MFALEEEIVMIDAVRTASPVLQINEEKHFFKKRLSCLVSLKLCCFSINSK